MRHRLSAGVLAVVFATAASADDTRTVFKFDGGSYEKTGNGKWVEKRGDETFQLAEKKLIPQYVQLQDATRKLTVTIQDTFAEARKDGEKAGEKTTGKWVAAPRPDPDKRDLDPKGDPRVLWKHDKGSFERVAKGKWIEKRGDDEYDLAEVRLDANAVHLRNDGRRLDIVLREKAADARKDGQPVSEKFVGEWVAVEKKDPDPKAPGTTPGDGKVPTVPVAKADKTVWKYDTGHFEKTGEGKWTERTADGAFEWVEKSNLGIKLTLEDTTRKLTAEIKAESALVRTPGQKISDGKTLKGEWVKYEPKSGLDPKADGRTVWKSPDVTFELSAPGVWTQTSGGNFKNVKKFTQKAVTEEYVELLDDESKLLWVRLTATARLERLTELNKYKAEGKPGGWLKVDKPDPKAAGRYAEVARLAPEKVEGTYALSPDGKQVARRTGDPFKPEFSVVEADGGKVVQKWSEERNITAAVWSGDGKTFAAYVTGEIKKDGKPSKVVVQDAATWEEKAAFELAGFHSALALSADGSRVACASGSDVGKATVHVYEVGTKKELFSKPMGETVFLSADGKTVGSAASGGFALFDVGTGKEKASYTGKGKFVMSADGGAVAEFDYTQKDGMILNVWEGRAKAPKTIKTKQFQAAVGVFLDDGKHLAVAGHSFANPKGDVVKVYTLKTLAEADSFLVGKETDLVSGLHLHATPDSSRLLTFGMDKYLRVWSTPFGEKKDNKK
jgi:hypothetical protein